MRSFALVPYLECSNLPFWDSFRDNRIDTADVYRLADQLAYDTSLLEIWQTGSPFLDDMCHFPKGHGTHYCLYGIVHILTIGALRYRDKELAKFVTSLFAQHSALNFLDGTGWALRWADLKLFEEGIWEMANDYVERVRIVPVIPPPSVLSGAHSENPTRRDERISILAVGTHPTLTLEPITSMGLVITVESARVYGMSYKCNLFPELCSVDDDELVALLGGVYHEVTSFRAGASQEEEHVFDIDRISVFLQKKAQTADLFLCTSPFLLCAIGAQALSLPMIAYLGLPTVWKASIRPLDRLWELGRTMLRTAAVVANNPLLVEQMDYQIAVRVPLVRPLALYTNVKWNPRNPQVVFVVRSKFLFHTLSCFIPHFMPDGHELEFKMLNTDVHMSFADMSQSLATILFPWEHVLMAFYEFYAMNMPLFMPAKHWMYRNVFNMDGNLGSVRNIYDKTGVGTPQVVHPYRPFGIGTYDAMRYWLEFSDFVLFPHVVYFDNLQEMFQKLFEVDLMFVSTRMAEFNARRLSETLMTWTRMLHKVLPTKT